MADYTCGVMNHDVGCMCSGKIADKKDDDAARGNLGPDWTLKNTYRAPLGYQHDPMKGASTLIQYSENVDPGKVYVSESLDDLFKRLSNCASLLEKIRRYPLDNSNATDPLYEVRHLETALGRLERKLKMCHLDETILAKQQEIEELRDEFKKVNGSNFL